MTVENQDNVPSDSKQIALNEKTIEYKKDRIRWIDQARGFIVLYMVIFIFFRGDWIQNNEIFAYFFDHPPADATYMNFYDIGASAFIFILGLLYGVSFFAHKNKVGTSKATLHILVRYGLILFFGLLIVFVDQGDFTEVKQLSGGGTITVVSWDVLPTLGLVGFIALPFLYLAPKKRIIAAYIWVLFYQIMLVLDEFTMWRTFAIKSVHGGILGTIFSFTATLIISSALGEYMFSNKDTNRKTSYQNFFIFGLVNFLVGIAISYIPGWEASKRQVSMPYTMISIGASILVGFIFIYLDQKAKKYSSVLDGFGKNPFLMYIMALVPEFLIYEVILGDTELWLEIVIFVVMMIILSVVAMLLYKKSKVISTEKVALWTIIIVGALAAILLGFDLVEL